MTSKATKNFLKAIRDVLGLEDTWTHLNPSPNPVEADRRLYIVVRNDLIPGLQISQSVHAKDEFTKEHPEVERRWANTSNTIIILSGTTNQLYSAISQALVKNVKFSSFKEPDLNYEVTAVAFEPSLATVELVKGLPLALKDLV